MQLIPIDKSDEHYRVCKAWLEDKDITRWLTSALRLGRYDRIIHDMLISERKNKLYFIQLDDRLVGLVGLSNMDLVDKRAEIWYLIGSTPDRGKNIATRAVEAIRKITIKDLDLVSFFAHAVESNVASIRVLERAGFEFVGRFRKAFHIDGSYQDLMIFDWVSD